MTVTAGNNLLVKGSALSAGNNVDIVAATNTGTLGFSDIHNRADFKTEHQGAGTAVMPKAPPGQR